jgi:stress-induced-phosphoprotein 1
MEHRTPEALTKLRAAEKTKATAEKDAYVDAGLAEKARELGQQKFQAADWPGAVDAFTEMTKRAPTDPRGYSNRAAALIKLMAFPQAVQDCDEAIARDSKFIRAYMRKGQALVAMKEYNRAIDTFTEAAEQDDGTHAREIEQQQQKCLEAQFSARAGETEQQTMERIQNDPEVCFYPLSSREFNPWQCKLILICNSRSWPSSTTPSCRASSTRPRATPPLCKST